ncbi:MAG: S-layer homology domain-containing protein [Candidatus Parabeggiatoa sp.]|nr:S-layer homology domain-containing protein [Candidatus Parabeggiatoa sp.]
MKKKFWNTTITLLTLVWLGLSSLQPQAAEFSDVLCGHWFQDEVILLKNKGILASREKFEPSRKVSRAEFIKMLISTMATKYREEKKEGEKKKVADCSDEEPWYKCFIKEAYRIKNPNYEDEPIAFFLKEELNKKLGRTDWILKNILELSQEHPDRKILHKILTDINASDDGESYLVSRSDAAHMMMNASRLAPDAKKAEFFEDFSEFNSSEKGWIGACKKADIFNGSPDSKTKKWNFKPKGELNRAEAAVILARAFFKSEITRLAQCNSVKVDIIAHQAGTMASPGAVVAESDEYYPEKLQVLANDDWDDGGKNRYRDHYSTGKWEPSDSDDKTIGSKDDDIVKLTLKPLKPLFAAGTMKLTVSEQAAVRIFKADGTVLSNYSVDLAKPEGDLAALASSPVELYVETLKPSLDISIKLAFERVGGVSKASESDKVHMISTFESILRSNIVRAAYNQDSKYDANYKLRFPNNWYQTMALCPINNPYWENSDIKLKIQGLLPSGTVDSGKFEKLIAEMKKNKNNTGIENILSTIFPSYTTVKIKNLRDKLGGGGFSVKGDSFPAVVDLIPFVDSEKRSNRGRYISECLSAITMVMYRGVAETFKEVAGSSGEARFNTCFYNIQIKATDSTALYYTRSVKYSNYYAGDWRYVHNPDYNKDNLESWRGENTIQLSNESTESSMFYWHNGASQDGVTTLSEMKAELHKHRLNYHRDDESLSPNARRPPRKADFNVVDDPNRGYETIRLDVLKLMKAALTTTCP